jgi:hypothetical protein
MVMFRGCDEYGFFQFIPEEWVWDGAEAGDGAISTRIAAVISHLLPI